MAVSLKGASVMTSTNFGGPVIVPKPVNTQPGNLLVATVVAGQQASITAADPGWTTLWSDLGGGRGGPAFFLTEVCFVKWATANEPSNYEFSCAGDYPYAVISAWSGAAAFPSLSAPANYVSVTPPAPGTVCPQMQANAGDVVLYHGGSSHSTMSDGPGGATSVAHANWSSNSDTWQHYYQAASSGLTLSGQTYQSGNASKDFGPVARTMVIPGNAPPNAPTLTAPANNATINRTVTNRFAWNFSDPNPNDSQSKFDLQYRQGSGAWTTVTQTTPNQFYDFAANYFAAGTYEWQVRTYDSQGVVGPWSVSSFFTAATPPDAPTITDPINGQTLPSSTYTVTFSYPSLTAYAWRVLGDNAGAPDTGNVINAGATVTDTSSRQFTVTGLPNSTTVHIQVQIQSGGMWSTWADSSNPVSYNPPPAPAATLTAHDGTGPDDPPRIDVAYTTPAPGAGQVAAVSVDVYVSTDAGATSERVATGLAINGTYIYRSPASKATYSFQVVAVAGSGVETGSGWAT